MAVGSRPRKPVSSAPGSIPVTLASCSQRPLVHDDFQELRCFGHGRHGKLASTLSEPPDLHVRVLHDGFLRKASLADVLYSLSGRTTCMLCMSYLQSTIFVVHYLADGHYLVAGTAVLVARACHDLLSPPSCLNCRRHCLFSSLILLFAAGLCSDRSP